jgi:hypothetical protein
MSCLRSRSESRSPSPGPAGMEEFVSGLSCSDILAGIFSAYLPAQCVGQHEADKVTRALACIDEHRHEEFDEFLRASWQSYWASLPISDHAEPQEVQQQWMKTQWRSLLSDFTQGGPVLPRAASVNVVSSSNVDGAAATPRAVVESFVSFSDLDRATVDSVNVSLHHIDPGLGSDLRLFIEAKWEQVWNDVPAVARVDEQCVRGNWIRGEVCTLLEEFARPSTSEREGEVFGCRSEHAFNQCADLSVLSQSQMSEASSILSRVKCSSAEELNTFVAKQWADLWHNVPAIARLNEAEARRKWFEEKGVALVSEFARCKAESARSVNTKRDVENTYGVFLPLQTLSTKKKNAAVKILSRIGVDRIEDVKGFVTEKWQQTWSGIPKIARVDEQNVRQRWLESELSLLLEEFDQLAAHTVGTSSAFRPEMSIEDCPEKDREAYRVLLGRVKTEHVRMIEQEVSSAVAKVFNQLPEAMRGVIDEASVRPRILKESYVEIVTRVVSARQDPAIVPKSPPMLVSPPKRRRLGSDPKDSAALPQAAENITIRDVHLRDGVQGECYVCQAFLLYFPEEVRWVGVSDRKTQEKKEVPVMTCVLGDRDGPLLVELWRDIATDHLPQFNEWSKDITGCPLVEMRYFTVGVEHRRTAHRIRKARSTDRTRITLVKEGAQPCVSDFASAVPSPLLYTSDFTLLSAQPPFLISLCGTVSMVGQEVVSQNSQRPMKSFRLNDQSGRWVQCAILGRHVDNECLCENAKVVVYFAMATAPVSAHSDSQLWLYDDAHVTLLQKDVPVGPARSQVSFGAK